ncbi:MAG: peptidylprolyl isomerase [Candidatus Omnitrophota bacterium]|nr:peptidylprolyl isomerase [Candidatus Omnitrophota bacterium]
MRLWIAGVLLAAGIVGGWALADDPVVAPGKKVTLDYALSVDNKEIETSKGKEPLVFVYGVDTIVPGLEAALNGMHVGEQKVVDVQPKDGYGEIDPKAFKEFPKTTLPKNIEPKVGMVLQAQAPDGENFPAVIREVKADSVVLDFNNLLAGKLLKFQIKVLKIEDVPAEAPAKK